MTDFFVRLLTSEKADWLQEHYPSAFLLLSHIARHCRRTIHIPDGLEFGDCIIGEIETPKKCGISGKEFRNARDKLIEFGLLEIVYHPKPVKTVNGVKIIFRQKRAIKRAIKSMVVNLCNSEIYDISFEYKGDQKVDQGANKGRPEGDKQRTEQKEQNVKEQTQTPLPPLSVSVVGCLFSCLDGLGLSSDEMHKICQYPEPDVKRAVQSMQEYNKKNPVKNVMGFLISALNRKFQPKVNPKFELTSFGEKNKEEILRFKNRFEEEIKRKDIEIKDLGDGVKFGIFQVLYEDAEFPRKIGSALQHFNLIHLVRPVKSKPIVEIVRQEKIVHLQHAEDIGKGILEKLEIK